jgi:hypothetical protein
MKEAGVSIESHNALDWFIWDSEFVDSARGVTDTFVAGNFNVYRSVFRNSTVADISIGNVQFFGIRGNTSIGSQMFFDAAGCTANAAQMTLQDNIILSPRQTTVIRYKNMGPMILLDNQIASPAGGTGPVVDGGQCGWLRSVDLLAVGNKFTVSNPYAVAGKQVRRTDIDTSIVAASQISTYVPPIPATPAKITRPVFEVPAGSNHVAIQNAVNQAAGQAGRKPVIHLPNGTYPIGQPIIVPANLDVQFVGDGRASHVRWSGGSGGTVFRLQGPSKASFRDISIAGASQSTAVSIEKADQPGSRVFGDMVQLWGAVQNNVMADALNYTKIDFQHLDHRSSKGASILSKSGSQGLSGTHRVAIFGGMSAAEPAWVTPQTLLYDVASQGKILATDIWYEGNAPYLINLRDSGLFTLNGANIAPYPAASGTNTLQVNNFNGVATIMGARIVFGRKVAVTGSSSGMQVLAEGMNSDATDFIQNSSTSPNVGFLQNHYYSSTQGHIPLPDQGNKDAAHIRNALKLIRSEKSTYLRNLGAGVTDVRLYNVFIDSTVYGIHVKPL